MVSESCPDFLMGQISMVGTVPYFFFLLFLMMLWAMDGFLSVLVILLVGYPLFGSSTSAAFPFLN